MSVSFLFSDLSSVITWASSLKREGGGEGGEGREGGREGGRGERGGREGVYVHVHYYHYFYLHFMMR